MFKILNEDNQWVEGTPSEGEICRFYYPSGMFIENIYFSEILPNKVYLTSHQSRILSEVNTVFNVTAEIQDPSGNVITSFNDSFAMPITRVGGAVEKTVLMTFENGICSKDISFDKSGEYEVTRDLVNMHLSEQIDFEKVSISIYE